jgi:hypothetical protein
MHAPRLARPCHVKRALGLTWGWHLHLSLNRCSPSISTYPIESATKLPHQNDTHLTLNHHVKPCYSTVRAPRVRTRDIPKPKTQTNDKSHRQNSQSSPNHPSPPTAPRHLLARHPLRARRVVPHLPNPRRLLQHLRPPLSAPQVLTTRSRKRAPPQPLCARDTLVSTYTHGHFNPSPYPPPTPLFTPPTPPVT